MKTGPMAHDFHEEELTPAKDETDGDDILGMLGESYYLISIVLERKLPKQLHTDLARLQEQLERALSWHKVH